MQHSYYATARALIAPRTPAARQLTSLPVRNVFRRTTQRSLKPRAANKQFHPRERGHGLTFPPPGAQMQQQKETPPSHKVEALSPLRFDSTFTLIKKFFIYKVMGSDIFINYSLGGMRLFYKLLGVRLTNAAIEGTAGCIFTGGVTLNDLIREVGVLETQNIGTVAMSVVEGLRSVSDEKLDDFKEFSLEAITRLSADRPEGHLALKLTAFVSTEVFEKASTAQRAFLEQVLQLAYDVDSERVLTEDELRANLASVGITDYSDADFKALVNKTSDQNNAMTEVSRYAGGHLFSLYGKRTALEAQLAVKLGAFTDADFEKLDRYEGRVHEICDHAEQKNCLLYVDAEQTFIQPAIESYGQQMTQKLNKGDKVIVMNGYQAYTRRMADVIPLEIAASHQLGFNLGVKLIRGAYMNEERKLAEEGGYSSPIWDSMEETHECYDECLRNVIENMSSNGMLFVASHNVDSCNEAAFLAEEYGFKNTERVRFAQLRGFSDQVTGQLASDGFKVYKYVPFGPTEEVMPYLVRRGQESRQVLREQKFQNETLKEEIFRRISPF